MESLCSSTRRLRHRGAEHRPMACAPQREFFPLLLRSGVSGVKTPLGAQTGKSVFLGSRDGGKKKQ